MTHDLQRPAEEPEHMNLGVASALIKARSERGMTQAQLAEVSGVSRSAIKGYETGRNLPGSRELKALCRVLKVSPNLLLFGSETPFDGVHDHDRGDSLRLLLDDPEGAKRRRSRLAILSDLITDEEAHSLLSLVHALAVARHGQEAVSKRIEGADFLAAMISSLHKEMAHTSTQATPIVDTQRVVSRVVESMKGQGHGET